MSCRRQRPEVSSNEGKATERTGTGGHGLQGVSHTVATQRRGNRCRFHMASRARIVHFPFSGMSALTALPGVGAQEAASRPGRRSSFLKGAERGTKDVGKRKGRAKEIRTKDRAYVEQELTHERIEDLVTRVCPPVGLGRLGGCRAGWLAGAKGNANRSVTRVHACGKKEYGGGGESPPAGRQAAGTEPRLATVPAQNGAPGRTALRCFGRVRVRVSRKREMEAAQLVAVNRRGPRLVEGIHHAIIALGSSWSSNSGIAVQIVQEILAGNGTEEERCRSAEPSRAKVCDWLVGWLVVRSYVGLSLPFGPGDFNCLPSLILSSNARQEAPEKRIKNSPGPYDNVPPPYNIVSYARPPFIRDNLRSCSDEYHHTAHCSAH
ncbi:hypothetical protein AXG93_2852s1070 [Marchantia polymorpha subsp. ruderalis]|uniref:Uncharacterized protein n=1 Tax=Marchantia polymorpha subsp. ruderalis TaxID=1480154 RepID=A0A176WJQ4_MARPO|nr:hypothetical protein AXG93_2852s1070 [Marchantia polymorpha subsp. ruderalis]